MDLEIAVEETSVSNVVMGERGRVVGRGEELMISHVRKRNARRLE